MTIANVNRRVFLASTAAVAGSLILGITLSACSQEEGASSAPAAAFNAFLTIARDGTITIQVPNSEMGQGVFTALPMILADELDADWGRVVAETAPADPAYGFRTGRGGQTTGGSHSVVGWYGPLREMGAAARHMLREAAADIWKVEASACVTEKSLVSHKASGRSLGYGTLAVLAAKRKIPENPTLKKVEDFTLIGHPLPRRDTPSKVDGTAVYGIDVKRPGMLIATAKVSPIFGGVVKSHNDKAALALPGVRAVVPVPAGVVVVADSYWQAHMAAEQLDIIFTPGPNGGVTSDNISAALHQGLEEDGLVALNKGDARAEIDHGKGQTLSAIYETPYLAHSCMEPMSCTAEVTADSCHIWAPTQSPGAARALAAKICGLPLDKVRVEVTFLGGGFGRRGETDFVEQAVLASKALRRPVKLIWSREEDIAHDFYRPASVTRLRAAFGKDGTALAFDCRLVAPSILARVAHFPKSMLDNAAVDGLSDQPYGFRNARVDYVRRDLGIPVGWWRSVGQSQNAFVRESFIDELAHMRDEDPFALRRRLLGADMRHIGTLDLVAEKSGWHNPPEPGRARGVALVKSFGSYVAQVVEISRTGDNGVKIHQVTCAVDCGTVINPSIVEAQIQSAVIYGLTAAVDGEITIKDGAVEQSNFHDYPALKIANIPEINVHLVPSAEPPAGIGEPGLPPLAPALANAIFALTGKRLRSLPFSRAGMEVT